MIGQMAAAERTREEERPRYFHLLGERELRALQQVLGALAAGRDRVLARWHELYLEHVAEARTLDAPSFLDLYGRDLDAVVRNLGALDMEGFEADVRALGRELLERGVPFAEVVVSLHLFEESASTVFADDPAVREQGARAYLTFDKLSHCRIILLASSYFAEHRDAADARLRRLEQEADQHAGGPGRRTSFHGLVGGSPAMQALYEQIAASAGGHGAVLVVGESGTGKELVARALHECAGSPERPFIAVNCAALPRELVESELFGHRRGAYTGAASDSSGLIRSASGGTLFLDEVTEMPIEMQAKLLRVLEEHAVRPVGGSTEVRVDVRFVLSTNRDPDRAVEAGFLRGDLYYRLNVHRIPVPALRDRPGDVPALVAHFAERLAAVGLRRISSVEEPALAALMSYAWPGNVRELRNVVEHALTGGKGPLLRRADLPSHLLRAARIVAAEGAAVPTFEEAERDLIQRALHATKGNKLRAARLLRISRHQLYDKLRKFGLHS